MSHRHKLSLEMVFSIVFFLQKLKLACTRGKNPTLLTAILFYSSSCFLCDTILNKLKNDLREILAVVKHCHGFETRHTIVTSYTE